MTNSDGELWLFLRKEHLFSLNTLTNGIASCKIILHSKENMTKMWFVE